jgi:hypothetical protein
MFSFCQTVATIPLQGVSGPNSNIAAQTAGSERKTIGLTMYTAFCLKFLDQWMHYSILYTKGYSAL